MVTLAHLSDIHMGSHDPQLVSSLVDDVAAHRPDAVVITGDLTTRARPREFAAMRDFLAALPGPQLVILGNHDVPLYQLGQRLTAPYARFQRQITADLDPVLDIAGARILGLQTMPRWRWKSGRVSRRQDDLIDSVFRSNDGLSRAADGDPLRIVAMHHPPAETGLATVAGIKGFRAAVVRSGVDVVLAGHTHVPSITEQLLPAEGGAGNVVEVVCGTSTSTRTRGYPACWMVLQADATTLTVTPRIGRSEGWAAGTPVHFDRVRRQPG